jgi:hypothetical protein
MMGQQKRERELFNYAVNLETRVRSDHPLRAVAAAIDFGFVRREVAHCYGRNGSESLAPEVILKMMFLLFFDYVSSERERFDRELIPAADEDLFRHCVQEEPQTRALRSARYSFSGR